MENPFTSGNIPKTLLAFAIPLILSGILQQMFHWVDAFIVGNVSGEIALAAIGATTAFYNLFLTAITGFASGLSVLSAQQCGMGEQEKTKRLLSSYTVIFTAVFLLVAVVGIVSTDRILLLLDTPESLLVAARDYLQVVLAGIPFLAVYNIYAAILRGIGNSKASFLAVLISAFANILLDLLFVASLHWGARGAAIATVLAQAAMTVYLVLYTVKKYPFLRFSPFKNFFSGPAFQRGAVFGLPPAAQSSVSSVGNVYLQQFMNGFGAQTVAAITTVYRVDTVMFLPIINLSSGIATMIAQNVGAGNRARARKVFEIGALLMAALSLILTALILALGERLIAMFGLTAASVAIGKSFFHAIAKFYLIYGLSMALRGYLEGIGDMLFSGIVGVLSLLVRILLSYWIKPIFGSMTVAYAEAFSWIFLLVVFLLRCLWKTRNKAASTPPQTAVNVQGNQKGPQS